MQLHNTTQYAIRILSYIAKNGNERLYSAKELAKELNISYKFLTKIMMKLVKADFVNSIKGRVGGYELKKEAKEISMIDILITFDDLDSDTTCILGIGLCDCNNKCSLHDQWLKPRDLIKKMYQDTTLDKIQNENYKL
ncbi:MAG: Rrf2 family transcriptional regulator [Campylobacterales bacterium]|nr:Rrf2 family transcriptional regulator [Campylobacterales bacterium]NQY53726.1 Rrf2 family transcriptional regulator [Campylobacteraceae bacterium]